MPKVSFKCLSIPFLPLISTAQWGENILEGELEIFSYGSGPVPKILVAGPVLKDLNLLGLSTHYSM
jgi:hypothetical protein